MTLEVKHLSFKYQKTRILDHISFSARKGCITAILGPNGVGKTTLLKCLNYIHRPYKGDILVNGRDIRKMSVRQIAQNISYVPQKNDALRMTVFDAVLMGRLPHGRYRTSPEDIRKVDSVLEHLNLSHLRLNYLNRLSGGELQKVAIARSLVQDTKIMLFDEPTSSLDMKNQTRILELIRRIVKSHNLSAVMTMHDLNAAMRYAEQYIFLKNGTIYSSGKTRQITEQMIQSVYGLPVEIAWHRNHPIIIPLDGEKAA